MFKKINNKGFTIVETLIVLAIAATIIAVVLLAVPALQQNSKNTQLKTAANNFVAAANAWSSNNNGTVPNCAILSSSSVTFATYTSGTTCPATGTGAAAIPSQVSTLSLVTTAPSGASATTVYYAPYQCTSSTAMGFTTAGMEFAYIPLGSTTVNCITAQ